MIIQVSHAKLNATAQELFKAATKYYNSEILDSETETHLTQIVEFFFRQTKTMQASTNESMEFMNFFDMRVSNCLEETRKLFEETSKLHTNAKRLWVLKMETRAHKANDLANAAAGIDSEEKHQQ